MSDRTIGQQLGDALAENERLRALLPPDLDPDLVARSGRCQPCNVYVGMPGDPDGYLLGKLPTPEWAAHIIRTLNEAHYGHGTVPAELLIKAAALRQFSKQILDGPAHMPLPPSIIAALALDAAADYEFEANELAATAEPEPDQAVAL